MGTHVHARGAWVGRRAMVSATIRVVSRGGAMGAHPRAAAARRLSPPLLAHRPPPPRPAPPARPPRPRSLGCPCREPAGSALAEPSGCPAPDHSLRRVRWRAQPTASRRPQAGARRLPMPPARWARCWR
eukprot:scaffold94181_cov59-Phaeocystis_antarctica.AAC.2